MPTTARAVRIEGAGGPEALKLGEIQVRDPGLNEVLVQIEAAGLNRADVLQRKGVYPAPPGTVKDVPGLEFAGKVSAVGDDVRSVAVGERVMGICAGGGMASHIVMHERELVPVPPGLSMEQAAAVPEVFMTAFDALISQGGLRSGQFALLHAVGSGVGTAALQLCLASGAIPIGTSRKADKLDRCRELGLQHAIDTADGSFAGAVKELTGGRMAQVVLDTIGGKYLAENIKAVALQGQIVVIGLLGGARAELNLGLLLSKRANLRGSVLRSRPLEEKIAVAQAFRAQVLPLLEAGQVKPIVEAVLPMDDIQAAHQRLEGDQVLGKLVMAW